MSKKNINLKIVVTSKGKRDVVHEYHEEVHPDHIPVYILDIASDITTTITYMILENENYPENEKDT